MRGVDRERQCEEEGEKGREGWGGGGSITAERQIERYRGRGEQKQRETAGKER